MFAPVLLRCTQAGLALSQSHNTLLLGPHVVRKEKAWPRPGCSAGAICCVISNRAPGPSREDPFAPCCSGPACGRCTLMDVAPHKSQPPHGREQGELRRHHPARTQQARSSDLDTPECIPFPAGAIQSPGLGARTPTAHAPGQGSEPACLADDSSLALQCCRRDA